MSAFRIAPQESVESPRQRRPRVEHGTHLDFIRQLPCVICFKRPVEAAHIRSGSRQHGKRPTGLAEKPSDIWTLPLCSACHRTGPDAQHSGNELAFYKGHHVNPFVVALALWAASGDLATMEMIVSEAYL